MNFTGAGLGALYSSSWRWRPPAAHQRILLRHLCLFKKAGLRYGGPLDLSVLLLWERVELRG